MNSNFRSILEDLPDLPSPDLIESLWAHWELVKDWNARVNLTSITADADAAWLHYRDSLAGLTLLGEGPVVDMGSGAGFPGIPLAIACPGQRFCLVEPRRKRASFLRVVAARLGLANVTVLTGRSTDSPPEPFTALVTRATFSSPSDLTACLRWVAPGGRLIAYRAADSEILDQATHTHSYSLDHHTRRLDVVDLPK